MAFFERIFYDLRKFSAGIFYNLFPRTCVFCDVATDKTRGVCDECEKKVEYVTEPVCKKCGKPLINEFQEYCFDCTKNQHMYDRGLSLYVYSDIVKESIYRFKYHNRREYAGFYGEKICDILKNEIRRMGIDAIIPVPIHRKKYLERGYNQAELLADEIGKGMKINVDKEVLIRNVYTRPQKELSGQERVKNLEKAFNVTENVVKYKKILLVDDIYTTGSTIDACSKVLKAKGVEKVYYISLSIGTGI